MRTAGLLLVVGLLLHHGPPTTADHSDQCGSKQKSTFLWSMTSPTSSATSFLFGTIHVAYDQVWGSVSPKVKEVLDKVESVVFELALYDPDTINGLIDCKQLDYGVTLRQVLPNNLFQRLKTYMRRIRQRFVQQSSSTGQSKKELWERFNALTGPWESRRPIWLLFLLYQLNEHEQGHLNQSSALMLDSFLAHIARERGKSLYSVESAREQCNPLVRVNQEQVIFAINYTLSYLEWTDGMPMKRKENPVEMLVRLYKCGDVEVASFEGEKFSGSEFSLDLEHDLRAQEIDRRLKLDIIEYRNIRMAARAHRLLQDHPDQSFLFAIGAGHFHGPFSLLNILRNYGYSISEVTEEGDITRLFCRSNNFKTFNELWVRRSNGMDAISDVEEPRSGSHVHFYLILTLIPAALIIARQVGRRVRLSRSDMTPTAL